MGNKILKPRKRRSIDRVTREILAVVMAGGKGTRLGPLTARNSKPAIPFGGKYRIIDFTLSNCINSGIRKICIMTQYQAYPLFRHIHRGWSFLREEFGEFIELLPAQERFDSFAWYQGTADSVYQNLDVILEHRPSYVLILAGDHIYKMDYGYMAAAHVESEADITVGCVEMPLKDVSQFGVINIDENKRIIGFQEKPANPQPIPGRPDVALASMGIYMFSTDFLVDILEKDAQTLGSSHDFGKDILPSSFLERNLYAFPFGDLETEDRGYWRDVGTVDAYWEANQDLIGVTPLLNLYNQDWPIHTYQEQLPPAKFVFDSNHRRGMAVDSMVSAGCIISGATVRQSLLSNNVRVNSYSLVEDSILLPGVTVERNCHIKRAIIDSDCVIPKGTVIGEDMEADKNRFHVTPAGIVLVCAHMLEKKQSDGV